MSSEKNLLVFVNKGFLQKKKQWLGVYLNGIFSFKLRSQYANKRS